MTPDLRELGRFLDRTHPPFTWLGWLAAAAIVTLSVIPASGRPVTGVGFALEHLGAFFVAGGLFAVGHAASTTRLALFAVAGCGLLEILQTVQPTRHARISDLMLNAAASLCAICLVAGLRRITRPATT